MNMTFSVYVGPYLIVPKRSSFDWITWKAIVRDGRCEDGLNEKKWILIPNRKMDGIDRQMTFDQHVDCKITSINPATIVQEMAAFSRLTSDLVQWCDDRNIEVHEAWGVVPCWS
jgi:hypothetical protein